jgi:hypothetical protein
VSAAVPPLVQCATLLPRFMWWFWDLTWVRFITRRSNAPYHHNPTAEDNFGSYSEINGDGDGFDAGSGTPSHKSAGRPTKTTRSESGLSTTSTLNTASTFVHHKQWKEPEDDDSRTAGVIDIPLLPRQESIPTIARGQSYHDYSFGSAQRQGDGRSSWNDPFSTSRH